MGKGAQLAEEPEGKRGGDGSVSYFFPRESTLHDSRHL